MVTSFPDIAETNGVIRIVRGFGITWPTGNPYLAFEEETAMRRAIVLRCLDALQATPTKPTVFWPNFGNCIGDQTSAANPTVAASKDWDWTIR